MLPEICCFTSDLRNEVGFVALHRERGLAFSHFEMQHHLFRFCLHAEYSQRGAVYPHTPLLYELNSTHSYIILKVHRIPQMHMQEK